MFLPFLKNLRRAGIAVSLREFLGFLGAMRAGIVSNDVEGFYFLARTCLVKDERHFDKFDRVFGATFGGLENITSDQVMAALDIPKDWLTKMAERHLSAEEMAEIQALGGFEKLMQTLRERLAEQNSRHQGGSKWIGTAGTSPFGAYGYNPEAVRIGQHASRHQRAVKIWEQRTFRNFDDNIELGTRNIKVALKRLRQWAHDGALEELDLNRTIRATAQNGYLEVITRRERRNAVKVLLFLDVGGSMDPYVKIIQELFSAARSEFKHLEYFYFHNCLYEGVWRDNARRWSDQIPTREVLRTYGSDYKCLFVGDASMSPYELAYPGGAIEHANQEAGLVWLQRATAQWPGHIWINPIAERYWPHSPSLAMVREVFTDDRMVPMTVRGIEAGMKVLAR
ncbi:MAG: VWA domain-containing protein [Paracoccaceae bacterium]